MIASLYTASGSTARAMLPQQPEDGSPQDTEWEEMKRTLRNPL